MSTAVRRVLALAMAIALAGVMVPGAVFGAEPSACEYGGVAASDVGAQTVWPKDAYESDDTSGTAKVLPAASYHTFHTIASMGAAGGPAFGVDQDWFKFTVTTAGTPYYIETMNDVAPGQAFDVAITIWAAGGTSPLIGNDDKGFPTNDAGLLFIAPAPGTYYVCMAPDDGFGVGSYWLYWGAGLGRRIAGANRYTTAVEASRLAFSSSDNAVPDMWMTAPDYVVVASGESFADGLTGGVLASFCDGPLLLTTPGALTPATYDEITRLFRARFYGGGMIRSGAGAQAPVGPGGGTVFVMGGPAAVSDAVVKALEANPYVGSVLRVAGANRYATAAFAMAHSDRCYGLGDTAFVVNGTAVADALAVTPVASQSGNAVLLTAKSSVPASTTAAIADMGIQNIVVVGGEGVVDATAYAALATLVPAGQIARVAGVNRYATARAVATFGIEEMGTSPGGIILCSGREHGRRASCRPAVRLAAHGHAVFHSAYAPRPADVRGQRLHGRLPADPGHQLWHGRHGGSAERRAQRVLQVRLAVRHDRVGRDQDERGPVPPWVPGLLRSVATSAIDMSVPASDSASRPLARRQGCGYNPHAGWHSARRSAKQWGFGYLRSVGCTLPDDAMVRRDAGG